jgi:hypothetical protein
MLLIPPDLLVIDTGIAVVGMASLLNPVTAGAIILVSAPVVMTSAIKPEPTAGVAPSALAASAVLEAASV